MGANRVARAVLAALLGTSMFTGCTPLRMRVPDELGQGEVYEAQQGARLFGKTKVQFGPWAARTTKGGMPVTKSLGFGPLAVSERSEDFTFELTREQAAPRTVECSSLLRGKDVQTFAAGSVTGTLSDAGELRLSCMLHPVATGAPAVLRLITPVKGMKPRHLLSGEVVVGDTRLELDSTGLRGEQDAFGVAGFFLREAGRVVASVQTYSGANRVQLAPGLSEQQREAVALAAAALMLHTPFNDLR